jgi:hypothetical protein
LRLLSEESERLKRGDDEPLLDPAEVAFGLQAALMGHPAIVGVEERGRLAVVRNSVKKSK